MRFSILANMGRGLAEANPLASLWAFCRCERTWLLVDDARPGVLAARVSKIEEGWRESQWREKVVLQSSATGVFSYLPFAFYRVRAGGLGKARWYVAVQGSMEEEKGTTEVKPPGVRLLIGLWDRVERSSWVPVGVASTAIEGTSDFARKGSAIASTTARLVAPLPPSHLHLAHGESSDAAFVLPKEELMHLIKETSHQWQTSFDNPADRQWL